jgi:hypothetical protein
MDASFLLKKIFIWPYRPEQKRLFHSTGIGKADTVFIETLFSGECFLFQPFYCI